MTTKKLWKELRHRLLKVLVPILGMVYIYVIGKTSKTIVLGQEQHDALREKYPHCIYVSWHEYLLPSAWTYRRRNIATLISQSRDGEYLSRLCRLLGFYPVRGSSSRGAVRGLIQLAHAAKQGHDVGIGADGPRGPARECKAGAILLAKRSGMPIIPHVVLVSRFKRLNNWDRTIIPFPFATFTMTYGDPIFIPKDADKETIAEYQVRVKQMIDRLAEETEALW